MPPFCAENQALICETSDDISLPMKILTAHNTYQQAGGEDIVYTNEVHLLRRYGHEVAEYLDDNRKIPEMSGIQLAIDTVWSRSSYKRISEVLEDFRPDLVHFHNTFPLISPSVYYAASKRGVPIVQTLHNYRLICPNAMLLRDGKPCEDCIEKTLPWPGIAHACYRGSKRASLGVATMLTAHNVIGTWQKKVDVYIALSEFARKKFIARGLPKNRIVVRPNYVLDDTEEGDGRGGYVLYVGRLSQEKGISVLLSAWAQMDRKIPLIIVGEGHESCSLIEARERMDHVTWLGARPKEHVRSLMRQAQMLIFPSVCYENFPLVIAEAYASGLPVVASRIGCLPDIIRNGATGRLFRAADPVDLVDVVGRLWNTADIFAMRKSARSEFETKYSSKLAYNTLNSIYRDAISGRVSSGAEPSIMCNPRKQPSLEPQRLPVSTNVE
jgi:glycosyltransferase involved in cell wall biosynthesis